MAVKGKKSTASSGASAKKADSGDAVGGCNQLHDGKVNPRWLAEQLGISRQAVVKRIDALKAKGVELPTGEDPKVRADPVKCAAILISMRSTAGRPAGSTIEAGAKPPHRLDPQPHGGALARPLPPAPIAMTDLPTEPGMEGALARARHIELMLSLGIAVAIRTGDNLRFAHLSKQLPTVQMNLSLQESNTLKQRAAEGRYVDKDLFLDAVAEILSKIREFIDLAPANYARKANPKDPAVAEAVLQQLRRDLFENLDVSYARIGRVEHAD